MALPDLAETSPCVGQEGVLIGFQCEAPVPALRVDCCSRAAIAVQRVTGDDLALERDQPERLNGRVQFRASVGGHGGQRQAQPRGIG